MEKTVYIPINVKDKENLPGIDIPVPFLHEDGNVWMGFIDKESGLPETATHWLKIVELDNKKPSPLDNKYWIDHKEFRHGLFQKNLQDFEAAASLPQNKDNAVGLDVEGMAEAWATQYGEYAFAITKLAFISGFAAASKHTVK